MSQAFIAEIRIFSFNFAPQGWAQCNGQFLPINQNQALFSLLGTTFGGNGQTTFALPDLRGRVPLHFGSQFFLGQAGGETAHTLTSSELPAHSHFATASSLNPSIDDPTNAFWAANTGRNVFSTTADTTMSPAASATVGGSQPHANLSPYQVLNFCICLQGIFPSQN